MSVEWRGASVEGGPIYRKYSRRRGGRSSSMGTGQALSTFNQFGFAAMRRHIKASSSASKSMRKWSPGLAGTAAGTVNRRFESSVTIMVGDSHYRPTVSICTAERRTSRKTEKKEWILIGRNIARGSARETRGRYERMTNWLDQEVIQQRVELLDEIIGILTTSIETMRKKR